MLKIKTIKNLPKEKVSVIKVVIGNKFFIGKTSNITWFGEAIKKAYGKYVFKNGLREDNMFFPIAKEIHRTGIEDIYIDVLFSSDNGYRVLQNELQALLESYGKKGCINTNELPIVPKTSYNEAHKDKWLTVPQSLNYYIYLKKTLQSRQ